MKQDTVIKELIEEYKAIIHLVKKSEYDNERLIA